MKARSKLSLLLLICSLPAGNCFTAEPTRDEVKSWTRQYESGIAAAKQLRLDEAFQQFMGALNIAERFGPKDIRLADNLRACGILLADVNQPAAAEPLLRRAAAVREAVRGGSHRETAWAWLDHAEVLTDLDKLPEAEALTQRARLNLEKAFGPYHPTVGSCLAAQAKIKAKLGQFTEAEALYQNALRFLSRTSSTIREGIGGYRFLEGRMNSMVIARTQRDLAHLYVAAGRYPDAVAAFREVVKQVESKQGKKGAALPGVLVDLAKAQMKQKDYAAAGATIERAVLLAGNIFGPEHPAAVITRFAKVNLLMAQEKWNEAEVEGVVTMAGAASGLDAMSEDWIPLVEAMAIINEKQGNLDNVKLHRARIAEIKQFHSKRFTLPEK